MKKIQTKKNCLKCKKTYIFYLFGPPNISTKLFESDSIPSVTGTFIPHCNICAPDCTPAKHHSGPSALSLKVESIPSVQIEIDCVDWNGVAPLAMPRRWRTVLKKQQAEKIP
jgi:hypothetical protein